MSEKYLVLGSNSFSGASFVDFLLGQGEDVIGVSRSPEPHGAFLPYRWFGRDGGFRFRRLDLNTQLDEIMDLVRTERPEYMPCSLRVMMFETNLLSICVARRFLEPYWKE